MRACSARRQPQDCVCPARSDEARTTASVPQEQRQSQSGLGGTSSVLPARAITASLPKTWPTKSMATTGAPRLCLRAAPTSARAASARRQPQDWVRPARSDAARTVTSVPHVHRQRHSGRGLQEVLPARAITVSRPNVWPAKSVAFTGRYLRSRWPRLTAGIRVRGTNGSRIRGTCSPHGA